MNIFQLSETPCTSVHFLPHYDWSIAPKPKVIVAFNRKFINYTGSFFCICVTVLVLCTKVNMMFVMLL